MNDPAVIRPAQPHEMPLVKELFIEYATEIANEIGLDLAFQCFDQELATLPGKYSPPLGVILIAELYHVPRGVVALRPLSDGIAEMKRLFVQPQARGFRLGRLLVDAVIEHARQTGYYAIRLDSLPHMQSAIALYRSLGFRDIPAYYENSVCPICLELNLQPQDSGSTRDA
jgi:ribosomal protein S18 acetylase RimI-like enzyme